MDKFKTVEDLKFIEDIDFAIVQAFYNSNNILENKYRDTLACCIIKNVLQGNFTKELLVTDFVHLSQLIQQAFPSEIPETYYVKGTNGGNATGKLRNQYLNIRTELAKVGLIQRKSRTKNVKPEKKEKKFKNDLGLALNLLRSQEVKNFDEVLSAWEATKEKRMTDYQGAAQYFAKYPILSTGAGYLLFEQDVDLDVTPEIIQAKFDAVKPKIFQKLSALKREQTVVKMLNSMSSDEGLKVALLCLIPFLFLPTLEKSAKRKASGESSSGVVKYSKHEAYLRFIPIFLEEKTLDESFPESDEVLCHFYKKLDEEKIIVIRVHDATYQFESIFEALIVYFKIHRALNLKFSSKNTVIWNFMESFFFNLETKETNPQVATLINELNLCINRNL